MDASPSSVRVSETKAQTESVMTLVEISAGYWLPRALHVVADLAIADALDQEPRSATDLAKEVGVVLMLWTEYCVLSPPTLSRALRSDHRHSMRAYVRLVGLPVFWKSWE